MRIGLDIDDTITDTFGIMYAYAQKFTIEDLKRDIEIKHIADISNTEYVQNMLSWTREEELTFFSKYFISIIEETTPYFFAVETINKLKEEGNEIILITARWNDVGIDTEGITKKWLKKHGIKYDKFIMNVQDKGEVAFENKLDVFVDDSLKNCLSVDSRGIKTYIMDNRCNTECNHPNVKRVYSWAHLESELRKEIG